MKVCRGGQEIRRNRNILEVAIRLVKARLPELNELVIYRFYEIGNNIGEFPSAIRNNVLLFN